MMVEWLMDWLGWCTFILVQIGLGWIIADFGSGVFHWAEDRYGSPRWPIFGGAIRDTIRHHRKPTGFLAKSVISRSWRMFLIAGVALSGFGLIGCLNAFTLTLVFGAAIANEIHAAAHSSPKQNGKLITRLQKLGVIQSHAHHAAHHRGLKNVNYCTITNWVNPVLERFRFWRRTEAIIRVVGRQRPRPDPVVRRRQRKKWHRTTA